MKQIHCRSRQPALLARSVRFLRKTIKALFKYVNKKCLPLFLAFFCCINHAGTTARSLHYLLKQEKHTIDLDIHPTILYWNHKAHPYSHQNITDTIEVLQWKEQSQLHTLVLDHQKLRFVYSYMKEHTTPLLSKGIVQRIIPIRT